MPQLSDMSRKLILSDRLKRYVDLNTDFGQTKDMAAFSDLDNSLLRFVSSVNIPCCVHDGVPRAILEKIAQAKLFNCAIGAHIGYPDPVHQGDDVVNMPPEDLKAWIHVQFGAFQALCNVQNATIEHVRPHGALYSKFINDVETACIVAEALHAINPWTPLVGPAGPVLQQVQERVGIRIAPEIYIGKHYTTEGTLALDRFKEDLTHQAIVDQIKQLIHQGALTSYDGQTVPVKYHTLHVSPRLVKGMEIAERIVNILGQVTPLSVVGVQGSGWILEGES